MSSPPRRALFERRRAVALVGLFVGGWVAFVFAGSLARANDLERSLTDARARTLALQARVDAGRAEIEFVESDEFLAQAARGLGYGTADEIAFALPDDAPPPPPVPIVGRDGIARVAGEPLDAWLDTLFGADEPG